MHKNDFDDHLRQLLNSQEFIYDPADWAKAEKLLQKRKKTLGFGWWSALVLAVGIFMVNVFAFKPAMPTKMAVKTTENTLQTADGEQFSNIPDQKIANNPPQATNTHTATVTTQIANQPDQPSNHFIPNEAMEEQSAQTSFEPLRTIEYRYASISNPSIHFTLHPEWPIEMGITAKREKYQPQLHLGMYNWWGQMAEKRESNGKRPIQSGFGLLADYKFSARFGLRFSPGLVYHSHIGLYGSRSDTSYSFGQQIIRQNAEVSGLLLLQLPLELYLQLAPRHQLGIGIQGNIPLSARYRLTTQVENHAQSIQSNENRSWVSLNDLNHSPVTQQLMYRYKLNDAIQLGLNYQFRQQNAAFEEARWRIYLAYNFYQRGL